LTDLTRRFAIHKQNRDEARTKLQLGHGKKAIQFSSAKDVTSHVLEFDVSRGLKKKPSEKMGSKK
jgi:hypothetical protein